MNRVHYKLLVKRILLLMAVYSFCRVLFYLFNPGKFSDSSLVNIFLAFLHGLRFDLSVVCTINIFFIFLSLLPFDFASNKYYQKFLKGLFLTLNIPFIFLNLIDIEYFKFTGKRTRFEILGIAQDLLDQSLQLLLFYWYIPVLTGLIFFILFKYYPTYNNPEKRIKRSWASFILLFSLGLTIFFIRGGLQLKPLRPNHAYSLNPNVLGNLVLNTPFTIIATYNAKTIEKVSYFPKNKLAQLIKPRYNTSHSFHSKGKENVVIIILESFSSEYLGFGNSYKGYTPFLDSLSEKSFFYKNNFANARSSMEGLPAIIASIPSLMDEPYITSNYQTNKIKGLGTYLSEQGYHTSFFHGGKNGTMGFDVFSNNAGFENYYGLNEYKNSDEDYDGHWGIFDEPFLQYFSSELSEFKQPFLSCVFTLSSHQPFTLPKQYKDKFPRGEMEIHKTIAYTDFALKRFFETAKKQSWFSNTLFVITADHSFWQRNKPEYLNMIGDYQIPLILYHPKMKEGKIISGKVTQQVDIMPTVLDYLNISAEERIWFGESALDTLSPGGAYNYVNGTYRLIHKDYFLDMLPKETKLFDYKKDKNATSPLEKPKIKDQYEEELKAYIQYYNNGLIENSWYPVGD